MSHWSRGTGVIKDLALLQRVAERMGVRVIDETLFVSSWAGEAKCVKTLKKNGGVAGVVETGEKGEYQIQMDNYCNPIVDTIGHSGGKLTHDYMVEMTREQATLMGGSIISETECKDGYTEILINVA